MVHFLLFPRAILATSTAHKSGAYKLPYCVRANIDVWECNVFVYRPRYNSSWIEISGSHGGKYADVCIMDVAPRSLDKSPWDGRSTHLWNVGLLQRDYTSQKALIFIISAVRTWNLKYRSYENNYCLGFFCAFQNIPFRRNLKKKCLMSVPIRYISKKPYTYVLRAT
jgi:hypothetical protein